MSFKGVLGSGEVIRVHAGCGPQNLLHPFDQQSATYHFFTGDNAYVWNNDRGDCSALWQTGESQPFDKACYDAKPPEGVILVRSGDRLILEAIRTALVGNHR